MIIPKKVINAAQKAERAYGIAASITLAQWCLESSYGQHMPPGSNNPFGIKAKPGQPFVGATTREFENGKWVIVIGNFRKFDSIDDAFESHAKLLATGKPYAPFKHLGNNPKEYVNKLTGVYATDPRYGYKLWTIIDAYNLTTYDNKKGISNVSIPVIAVVGSSVAVVASKVQANHAHVDNWLVLYILVGILFAGFALLAFAYIKLLERDTMAIRPEAQPIIDAVTKLANDASTADARVESANAAQKTAEDAAAALQTQLDAANATIAQMKADNTDTDSALKTAAGI